VAELWPVPPLIVKRLLERATGAEKNAGAQIAAVFLPPTKVTIGVGLKECALKVTATRQG